MEVTLSSWYIQFLYFKIMSSTSKVVVSWVLAHMVEYISEHVRIVKYLYMNLDQPLDKIMGNHFLKQNFE